MDTAYTDSLLQKASINKPRITHIMAVISSAASYAEVLLSLGRLNRKQLEEVRRRAAFFLQHKTEPDSVEDEDWLLTGILTELRRRGLDSRSFRIKRASSYASFQTQSENVRELLLTAAPGLTAVQRRALGEVAAYELASYLSWTDVSRETMLTYVARIPEAIDRAYPGYMASQLLGLVVR